MLICLCQVWSLEPGVWVKSRVFGHQSESSLKSFNGSPKKIAKIQMYWNLPIYESDKIYDLLCKKKQEVLKG